LEIESSDWTNKHQARALQTKTLMLNFDCN
jgi:hypothetical protein